jgi:REP element-mobilizing transposase RayT
MVGIVRGEGGTLFAIGGNADHVHMLLKHPAALSVAELLRLVKSNSSKWANEQPSTRRLFGWQRGYAAFSVSQSLVGRVGDYIERQESHHRKVSFQEELIALLKKHGVEYDERYIWS